MKNYIPRRSTSRATCEKRSVSFRYFPAHTSYDTVCIDISHTVTKYPLTPQSDSILHESTTPKPFHRLARFRVHRLRIRVHRADNKTPGDIFAMELRNHPVDFSHFCLQGRPNGRNVLAWQINKRPRNEPTPFLLRHQPLPTHTDTCSLPLSFPLPWPHTHSFSFSLFLSPTSWKRRGGTLSRSSSDHNDLSLSLSLSKFHVQLEGFCRS